jgi:hypothetical protein
MEGERTNIHAKRAALVGIIAVRCGG